MLTQGHRFIAKVALTRSGILQLSMHVNASAPYVSVHEPLLYCRKNRLIKRQLVDLRYSLCLRGNCLSLSFLHTHTLCFSPCSSPDSLLVAPQHRPGSPVSLRLSFAGPVVPPFFLFAFLFLLVLYGCAGVHRCQLSRIIIHSERMWFPFQITKYGASEHCAPHTSFGCSAIFFLAAISSGLDLTDPLRRGV